MTAGAYYNESDPFAAAWLRELIRQGHIAAGEVDDRDIRHVRPSELRGFAQHHFFAGIGVWSYALRLAGWPDDRPVWTGSCPCQPFSAAGRRRGQEDERHLWPVWFQLIRRHRPALVLGEQVSSRGGLAWFDLVSADMEAAGYALWAADLCAAGAGAPHVRQRLFFLGYTRGARLEERRRQRRHLHAERAAVERAGAHAGELAEPYGAKFRDSGRGAVAAPAAGCGSAARQQRLRPDARAGRGHEGAGPWTDAEWLPCLDEKARPVEPGTFPLAHGAPRRVGRLRGYGNAIVPQVAAGFIAAALEAIAGVGGEA